MSKLDLIIGELYILNNNHHDLYIVKNLDNIYGLCIKTLYSSTFCQIGDIIMLSFYIYPIDKKMRRCRLLSRIEKLKYL